MALTVVGQGVGGSGQTGQGVCQAYVCFSVSGGVCTNRSSFNVSSITYNGAGDYTVTLTNALADVYWAMVGGSNQSTGNASSFASINVSRTSTSSVIQVSYNQGGTRFDPSAPANVSFALYR